MTSHMSVLIIKLSSVTTVEEDWLKVAPNLLVSPMLTEYISWIVDTIQMMNGNKLHSDSFPNAVEGQGIVTFVELGMWDSRAVNHSFVVTEHVACRMDQHAKVMQGGVKVNDLINTSMGYNEF